MDNSSLFEIKNYEFTSSSLDHIYDNQFVKGLWPLVYILSDGEVNEAYVGETTDALSRMKSHLSNSSKNKLTSVHLITSDKFNKSATLDIEANLIKYISGDGKYKLLNANIGLANHTYYQKNEMYKDLFDNLWNELKQIGIAHSSIEKINNSDLFKYSPYKSLTTEQKNSLVQILDSLIDGSSQNILVEGGAGTGKTIVAIFLFKLLNTELNEINLQEFSEDQKQFVELVNKVKKVYANPKMALVVPMAGFRATLKKVFKNIKGLSSSMVIGPAEVVSDKFDIIIVDESHRLRKRVNLGAYYGAFDRVNSALGLDKYLHNELDWVTMQSNKCILFYDENQSIKPSDVDKSDFDKLKADSKTTIKHLKSQFRVKGGDDYVSYINKLLTCDFRKSDDKFTSSDYEFKLLDSIDDLVKTIKEKDSIHGLSRLVAGYSWKWESNKRDVFDIEIGEIKLKWNSTSSDWVNSENAIHEVGCIHTTQGYDLNYTGVIFGNEISYDKEKNIIVIKPENYHDKNGKNSITNPEKLKSYILNIYKTILLRGIKGTYVYVCDKNLREYFRQYITLNKELKKELVQIVYNIPNIFETVKIPMFETVGCGNLMYADSTIQEMMSIRKDYISGGSKYFILRTAGDSMNKAGINDGDLVLCRKNYQPEIGSKVVALIGDDATIKEYHRENNKVVLKPCSTNPVHKPIIIDSSDDIKLQGTVVKVLKS